LREEIVKNDCSLESVKFKAFQRARIFPPKTRREFFNRIDPEPPVASVRYPER
jgi:hypothetical protein